MKFNACDTKSIKIDPINKDIVASFRIPYTDENLDLIEELADHTGKEGMTVDLEVTNRQLPLFPKTRRSASDEKQSDTVSVPRD